MKAENFCFWLQGFFELGSVSSVGNGGLTAAQAEQIKTHLALVFKHDPTMAHPAPPKPGLPAGSDSLADRIKRADRQTQTLPKRRIYRDGVLYC